MCEHRNKRRNRPVLALATACGMLWACYGLAAESVIDQGKEIATKGVPGQAPCMTCHGANGEGMAAAGFPSLAGQPATYLAAQLAQFADGSRKQAVMQPVAKALNEAQQKAVAAWYASLKPVVDPAVAASHRDTYPKGNIGAWLAQRGDWSRGLPACVQCHGPGGVGVAPSFPALAGQSAMYIKNQLLAWKAGTRAEDSHGLMAHLARKLTDQEIEAVSGYFSKDVIASASASTSENPQAKTGGQQ